MRMSFIFMSKKESNKQIMTKLKEETSLDVSVEEQNYLNQLTTTKLK